MILRNFAVKLLLEAPSTSVTKSFRPSRSLLIVISNGMSFGTELNGFVNGANDFDPSKSAIFFDQPILAPPTVFGDVDKVEAVDSHFQVFLLPFLVPLKKVKMHNSIACKSQLCALHVTNTPATQTYV